LFIFYRNFAPRLHFSMSVARPLYRVSHCGLSCASAAIVRYPSGFQSQQQHLVPKERGRQVERDWLSWRKAAAAGAAAFALAETSRHQHCLSCSSVKRVAVGKADDFTESHMRAVTVESEGRQVELLIHRHADAFYATSSASSCPHFDGELKTGVSSSGGRGGAPTVSGCVHDATYDLKSGRPIRGPSLDSLPTYAIEVVDGTVFVDLPSTLPDGSTTEKREIELGSIARRDAADKRVFVLVGGGCASYSAAETLRREGFGGRIVMLSKEAHLPYYRGALSKGFGLSAKDLCLRTKDFYDELDIEIVQNVLVTTLDGKAQTVAYKSLETQEAQTLAYDRILVASGGLPRKLFCPGANLKGIYTLRTPEDALAITKSTEKGKKVIVVGGSFIGMEIASSLHKKGCSVKVVAMETVPFERVLGKKVGVAFARLLQKEGVEWYGSSRVRHFRGNNWVNGVELEDGEVLQADAVVIGAGVLPNTRFVQGTSLDKNGGIVVGPFLNSEACPTLFAAGDVCTFPSARMGSHVRIEHWNVATQHGRIAAKNMLGHHVPFTTIPFFWSELFDRQLRFVGFAPEVLDRVIIEGDAANLQFVSYYTQDDEVQAVATINKDPLAVACAELMRRGKMPKVSELMVGVANSDVIMQRLQELK